MKKETKNPLLIEYPDGSKSVLNENLIIKKQVSKENIKKLVKLHLKLREVYTEMAKTDDPTSLKKLAKKCTAIEFKQQECWGFPKNANFHNWYHVPKCECPKIDNSDMRGTPYQSINLECPIHGKIKK
jgi:(2Fe-2S) ferredoxin